MTDLDKKVIRDTNTDEELSLRELRSEYYSLRMNGDTEAETFEDYLDQGGETWFLTGKREYSVEAMMVSKETAFHNDLEVTDYTVTDDGVSVNLKGTVGELWVSSLPKVISTYTGDKCLHTSVAGDIPIEPFDPAVAKKIS